MLDPGNRHNDVGVAGVGGFTLLELLLVVAIIAMVGAGVGFALRDQGQTQLEREAHRLVALLESARAQSRTSGLPVYWHASAQGFEFVGLPPAKPANDAEAMNPPGKPLITPWLAQGILVRDDTAVVLGPEPIIERQSIVLLRAERSLRIATDGLRPFAVQPSGSDQATGSGP